jgi:hypothetical protein
MLFACGIIVLIISIIGVVDRRFGLILDYENGSEVMNFSGVLIAYGLIIVGGSAFNKFTTPLTTAGTITTIVILFTLDWFIDYGHVPRLDVVYRDYDTESVCWDGIVKMDNNAIQNLNCFTVMYKQLEEYCALCRSEYYMGEPTFLKTRRFTIIIFPVYVLLLQITQLYYIYKKETTEPALPLPPPMPYNETATPANDNKKIEATYVNFNDNINYDEEDSFDDDDEDDVSERDGNAREPYYAIPNNNAPLWRHAPNTFLAISQKPTAPPLSSLISSSPVYIGN